MTDFILSGFLGITYINTELVAQVIIANPDRINPTPFNYSVRVRLRDTAGNLLKQLTKNDQYPAGNLASRDFVFIMGVDHLST